MGKKRQTSFEFDTKELEAIRYVYANADQENLIKGLLALYLEYIEIKRIEGQRKGKK